MMSSCAKTGCSVSLLFSTYPGEAATKRSSRWSPDATFKAWRKVWKSCKTILPESPFREYSSEISFIAAMTSSVDPFSAEGPRPVVPRMLCGPRLDRVSCVSPSGARMQKAVLAKRPSRIRRTIASCSLFSKVSRRTQTNSREASINSLVENKLFCVWV